MTSIFTKAGFGCTQRAHKAGHVLVTTVARAGTKFMRQSFSISDEPILFESKPIIMEEPLTYLRPGSILRSSHIVGSGLIPFEDIPRAIKLKFAKFDINPEETSER
jgi:hypothetical protein